MLEWYKVVNERTAAVDDLADLDGMVESVTNNHNGEEEQREECPETLVSRDLISQLSTSSTSRQRWEIITTRGALGNLRRIS